MKHHFTTNIFIQSSTDYQGNRVVVANICDMSDYGYTPIDTIQVSSEYELPDDFNFTQAEIESLQNQKQKIQAAANVALHRIDEKIQTLRCLEHKTEIM